MRKWASVPFLWLFFSGFSYMSLFSLMDVKLFQKLAMEELEDRFGSRAQAPVLAAARKPTNVHQRIHALWMLQRLQALEPSLVRRQLA